MNSLSNTRLSGESFKNYRARLKLVARQVRNVLSGRFLHVSSKIVELPPAGVDDKVDEAIQNGQYRDAQSVMGKDGKEIRVARTKGETRLHPTKIAHPDMKRRERRALFAFDDVQ